MKSFPYICGLFWLHFNPVHGTSKQAAVQKRVTSHAKDASDVLNFLAKVSFSQDATGGREVPIDLFGLMRNNLRWGNPSFPPCHPFARSLSNVYILCRGEAAAFGDCRASEGW